MFANQGKGTHMSNEVITQPKQAVDLALEGILRAASDPGIDAAKLNGLLDAQERILAYHAKQSFNTDFALMQAEIPPIPKKGAIKISGRKDQPYERLEDIQDITKPVLKKYGFSMSYRTGFEGDNVLVTSILRHKNGHTEETTILLPRDPSGSKNNVQGVGSSVSYGMRYTIKAILGLTIEGADDDGNGGVDKARYISPSHKQALINALGGPGEKVKAFCEKYDLADIGELGADQFDKAMAIIKRENNTKKDN
jgi:hypothetical protein